MNRIVVTQTENEFFLEQGYLEIDHAIEDGKLQPVIDELNSEIDIRARRLEETGDLPDIFENEPFETRQYDLTLSLSLKGMKIPLTG